MRERHRHQRGDHLKPTRATSGDIPSPLGAFDGGVETPRIRMTLTTGIPEERCRRVNLGHTDYRTIETEDWAGRQEEGVLLVPHAGGVLYRAEDPA